MMLCRWHIWFVVILLTALALPWSVSSQNSVDSLQSKLEQIEPDDKQYVQTIIQLCEKLKQTENAYLIPGLKTKGLAAAGSLSDSVGLVKLHSLAGDYYWQVGLLTESAEEFNQIRILAESSQNDDWKALSYNGLGTVYYLMEDYSEALQYYQDGIQITKTDSVLMMRFYNNIANVYALRNEMDSVLHYYQLSIDYDIGHQDYRKMAITYTNMALAHDIIGNPNQVRDHMDLALKAAENSADPYQIAFVYQVMGGFVYERHVGMAISLYKEALKYAILANAFDMQLDLFDGLVYYYSENKAIDSAYYYLDKAYGIKDSLDIVRNSKGVSAVETEYESALDQFARDFETHKAELERKFTFKKQRTLLHLMGIGLLVLALILFILYQTNRTKASVNKKLEAANATKDLFFSLISHDLRSPLSGAIGLSEVISEGSENIGDIRLSEYAKSLNSSLYEVKNLIDNLLQWAQAESGRVSFNPDTYKISNLADESIYLLKDVSLSKSIQIINQIPQDLTCRIDQNMINTIFRNLISNSIKYTESGGEIVLKAMIQKDFVEISVSDTGRGIPKDKVEHLFNSKKLFTTPGTENEKGSGLGLLLCKEFVTIHHGTIHVESELNKGTKISMQFPLNPSY